MHRLLLPLCLLVATPALAQDCAAGHRLVLHPLIEGGSACVPEAGRIAWVEATAINAWLLGHETATANVYFDFFRDAYPGAVPDSLRAGMLDIGYLPDADFEALAALAPDLIVTGDFWATENGKLALIAPTVVIDYEGQAPDWTAIHDVVAVILGEEAQAAAQMAEYEARLADLRGLLGDDPGSFAIARMMDTGGQIQVFTELNFGAQQLLAAGLRMHVAILSPDAAAALNRPYWYALSAERLTDLSADLLVLLPGWDPAVEAEMTASALWQGLDPVASGRVLTAGGEGQHWIRDNIAFAHLVLDEVHAQVLGLDPATVSPNPFAGWLAD